MRVRQADIAKAAGISQPAVSVVLRGGGDQAGIPDETQRRVLEVARRMGYAPNPVARSLQGSRTQLLGVHSFEAVFPIDRRDYYYEFLLGVEEQAEIEGYDLVLFTSTAGGDDRRRRVFRDGINRLRTADGSVLLGRTPDTTDLARLVEEAYPFVHIGRRDVPGVTIPSVACDYGTATAAATRLLVEHGHHRIAYIGTRHPFEPQIDRYAGFRQAVDGLAAVAAESIELEPAEVATDTVRALQARGITGVLLESDRHADAVREASRELGLSLPTDLSVVVLDQGPDQLGAGEGWSHIGIPRAEMGREAVRVLLRRLADPTQRAEPNLLACRPAGAESIAPPLP